MDTPKENSGADAKVDGSSFAEVVGRRKRIQPEPSQTEKDRTRSSSAKRMKQQAPKPGRQERRNEGSRVSKKPREKEANQSNDVREREGRDRNRDNTEAEK